MKQLNDAEEQLSAVKALTPTNRAQQKEMHRRLLQAEQDVQTAAAAAQEATRKLQLVLAEKDKVQQELQDIKQQLEDLPVAQQHADLYNKLAVGSLLWCHSSTKPAICLLICCHRSVSLIAWQSSLARA